MFFDGKAYTEFLKDKEDKAIEEMNKSDKEKDKEEKKEKKDSIKAEKKAEELILDLENRKDRIVKLTRFSGRLGDHYMTQDGKKLYYMVRLEKSCSLIPLKTEAVTASMNIYINRLKTTFWRTGFHRMKNFHLSGHLPSI